MRSLKKIVAGEVKAALQHRGFGDTRIITDWDEIAGGRIARFTCPVRVKYSSRMEGGRPIESATLVVKVDKCFALEFSYMEQSVLEKIAAYFGYKLIARLQILHAPVTVKGDEFRRKVNPQPDESLSCNVREKIGNWGTDDHDELKAKLQRLGESIYEKS